MALAVCCVKGETNIHINGIILNICQKSFCFLLCNDSPTTMPQVVEVGETKGRR